MSNRITPRDIYVHFYNAQNQALKRLPDSAVPKIEDWSVAAIDCFGEWIAEGHLTQEEASVILARVGYILERWGKEALEDSNEQI